MVVEATADKYPAGGIDRKGSLIVPRHDGVHDIATPTKDSDQRYGGVEGRVLRDGDNSGVARNEGTPPHGDDQLQPSPVAVHGDVLGDDHKGVEGLRDGVKSSPDSHHA